MIPATYDPLLIMMDVVKFSECPLTVNVGAVVSYMKLNVFEAILKFPAASVVIFLPTCMDVVPSDNGLTTKLYVELDVVAISPVTSPFITTISDMSNPDTASLNVAVNCIIESLVVELLVILLLSIVTAGFVASYQIRKWLAAVLVLLPLLLVSCATPAAILTVIITSNDIGSTVKRHVVLLMGINDNGVIVALSNTISDSSNPDTSLLKFTVNGIGDTLVGFDASLTIVTWGLVV